MWNYHFRNVLNVTNILDFQVLDTIRYITMLYRPSYNMKYKNNAMFAFGFYILRGEGEQVDDSVRLSD